MRKKRGQGWGFDVMIASMIFAVALITFYFFALNYGKNNQTSTNDLMQEANVLADNILTEGIPREWNQTSVTALGILTKNRINETKLEQWYTLSQENYPFTKVLLNIKSNYFVNFSESMYIGNEQVQGLGLKPEENSTIFRVSRFTTYREKPITLYVIIWK